MEAETTIRREGKLISIALPPPQILRKMKFAVGQTLSLQTTPNGLLIKSKRVHYTAAKLNRLCDPNAPMPPDLLIWERM